jgi:membrane protein implicated in regulation of membrane protease activity
MQESSRLRFDLCYWGTLAVLSIGTGVYFAFHLAWNLILVSFLLVCIAAISAVAGFYRTWRNSRRS